MMLQECTSEIKSKTISVSEGIKKLKEILIENTILLDAAFLDLKANSQIKLQTIKSKSGHDADFLQQAGDVLATAGINRTKSRHPDPVET